MKDNLLSGTNPTVDVGKMCKVAGGAADPAHRWPYCDVILHHQTPQTLTSEFHWCMAHIGGSNAYRYNIIV